MTSKANNSRQCCESNSRCRLANDSVAKLLSGCFAKFCAFQRFIFAHGSNNGVKVLRGLCAEHSKRFRQLIICSQITGSRVLNEDRLRLQHDILKLRFDGLCE